MPQNNLTKVALVLLNESVWPANTISLIASDHRVLCEAALPCSTADPTTDSSRNAEWSGFYLSNWVILLQK